MPCSLRKVATTTCTPYYESNPHFHYCHFYHLYHDASQAKHLQFVTGVRGSSYWMANVTWDFAICAANVVAICILTAMFQIEEFEGDNLLSLFLLMVGYVLFVSMYSVLWYCCQT